MTKKSGTKVNEHLVYLMAGLHDFWRITDVNLAMSDIDKRYYFDESIGKPVSGAGNIIFNILAKNEELYKEPRRQFSLLEFATGVFDAAPETRWTFQQYVFSLLEHLRELSMPGTPPSEKSKFEAYAIKEIEKIKALLRGFPLEHRSLFLKDLELLQSNLKVRRKFARGSQRHHLGPRDMYWYFTLFGYPPQWTKEIVKFILVHDEKYITPDTIEGRIAQDGDILDSVGGPAVEKTYDVGKRFKNKFFKFVTYDCKTDPVSVAREKAHWESGFAVDTMAVILALRYKWPSYLNTEGGKEVAATKLREMEDALVLWIKKDITDIKKSLLDELTDIYKDINKNGIYTFWISQLEKIKSLKKTEPDNYPEYPDKSIDNSIAILNSRRLPNFVLESLKGILAKKRDKIFSELQKLSKASNGEETKNKDELTAELYLLDIHLQAPDKYIQNLKESELNKLFADSIQDETDEFQTKFTRDKDFILKFFNEMMGEYLRVIPAIIDKKLKAGSVIKERMEKSRFWDDYGVSGSASGYWTRMFTNIHQLAELGNAILFIPHTHRTRLERLYLMLARECGVIRKPKLSKLGTIELRREISTLLAKCSRGRVSGKEIPPEFMKKINDELCGPLAKREALEQLYRKIFFVQSGGVDKVNSLAHFNDKELVEEIKRCLSSLPTQQYSTQNFTKELDFIIRFNTLDSLLKSRTLEYYL